MSMTHIERPATTFDSYRDRFRTIRMPREDGILEMRFHTDGGPLRWSLLPHRRAREAFLEVGRDRDNRCRHPDRHGRRVLRARATARTSHLNRKAITAEAYGPMLSGKPSSSSPTCWRSRCR